MGGVSSHHGIGCIDTLDHVAPCSDDTTIADMYTFEDGVPATNPDMIAYHDFLILVDPRTP